MTRKHFIKKVLLLLLINQRIFYSYNRVDHNFFFIYETSYNRLEGIQLKQNILINNELKLCQEKILFIFISAYRDDRRTFELAGVLSFKTKHNKDIYMSYHRTSTMIDHRLR